jgi:hypothetical protein
LRAPNFKADKAFDEEHHSLTDDPEKWSSERGAGGSTFNNDRKGQVEEHCNN